MGIKQLTKLIKENSKKAIVERPLSFYSDKKVAIDASMFIYQFLIAVRTEGNALGTDDNVTSHLVGLFYRTINIVEAGITPLYIFDGIPPSLKLNELKKRLERREKADLNLKKAEESGDKLGIEKYEKRKIKVEKDHVEDCKKLLKLMGIPFLVAPSEAEAFCSFLCLKNYADYVATEDMDALTFGAPFVLRNFTAGQPKKVPVLEYNLSQILKDFNLNMNEFIDLCILLGCDYCETLKGVGLKRALGLIKKYKTIEKIIEEEISKDKKKGKVSIKVKVGDKVDDKVKVGDKEVKVDDKVDDSKVDQNNEDPVFDFDNARTIFKELIFLESDFKEEDLKIKWNEIDLEKIKDFLVKEKQFDEVRVTNGVNKLIASQKKPKQSKLDRFFIKKV